jgi:hypothetical protein
MNGTNSVFSLSMIQFSNSTILGHSEQQTAIIYARLFNNSTIHFQLL